MLYYDLNVPLYQCIKSYHNIQVPYPNIQMSYPYIKIVMLKWYNAFRDNMMPDLFILIQQRDV